MPHISTDDGVRLHVEETGAGFPVLFVHEFAGDHRSWEPQVRALSRRYRCITYAARGYPPSDVPQEQSAYSQARAVADAFRAEGAAAVAERYAVGPARVQFQNKDPRGWAEFAAQLGEHDSTGSALTMRGVQAARPSLYDLTDELRALDVPTLLIAGDEDEGCLEPSLMLKRTIPAAGLAVLPRTGHTCNLEEPELFDRLLERFFADVENGAWGRRDPRSLATSTTGMDER